MSRLAFLRARCWLDEDGYHVWTAHDCVSGRAVTMLPHPTWSATGHEVTPSINCTDCGAHYFGVVEQSEENHEPSTDQ